MPRATVYEHGSDNVQVTGRDSKLAWQRTFVRLIYGLVFDIAVPRGACWENATVL